LHCWWGHKMMQPLWKTVWQFLKRDVLHDPAVLLLGIYPRELKTCIHTKTQTQMFIAAPSTIAPNCKHPKCPPIGDWTK
ncbi:LORF2 protein, partial [Crocuta crocuta]